MLVEQFEDGGLAHFSYALLSRQDMVLIDPARDPSPYYRFAEMHGAKITAVIETHPHADFVSSHLEIYLNSGAEIRCSSLSGAMYPHRGFDEGQVMMVGNCKLTAMNTPGHSPDSICVLAEEMGYADVLFSGDTLFAGDVGRPDLRENTGNIKMQATELAEALWESLERLKLLNDSTRVYPSHGAGSLCGKSMSTDKSTTIGLEKVRNSAFMKLNKKDFVSFLLNNQSFIPAYFSHAVELNRRGAEKFRKAVSKTQVLNSGNKLKPGVLIIDTRPRDEFRQAHLKGAINLQDGLKFETWLGAIIVPGENFYLIASSLEKGNSLFGKVAKIGYEDQVLGMLIDGSMFTQQMPKLDLEHFRKEPWNYIIVDIRNEQEREEQLFSSAIAIPLPQLRNRLDEIPAGKPVVVHCAGGYRSPAGASIIAAVHPQEVYDLGEAVQEFQ